MIKYNKPLARTILFCGCFGALVNFTAVVTGDNHVFLYSQLIGAISALLYDRFLIGKTTALAAISSTLTILSALTGNQTLYIAGILLRTISYQYSFYLFLIRNKVFG